MAQGFDKNLDLFTEKLPDAVKEEMTKLQDKAFSRLRELTPVASGRAKEGWFKEDKRNGDKAVVNEVPYIVRLENGYSGQAPRGMVAVFVAEESMK